MKLKKGLVHIGTSNIVLPGNRQTFPAAYQDKSRLHYYSSIFNTLEINSSFYKIPMAKTFAKWSMDVPGNFQFTVKLSRDITHAKELIYDASVISKFINAASQLGEKKGCLLMQFPGKINLDYFNKVEKILHQLKEVGGGWRVAVEFRNATWYTGETNELLDEHKASLVIQDLPKARNEIVNNQTDFVYIRFHGPAGNYRGSYSDDTLNDKAKQITSWIKEGKDVYAYFNNTIGSAFENAMFLKKLIR